MLEIEKMLSDKPKYIIGLAQAAAVAVYVLLSVTAVINFGSGLEHTIPPMLSGMIFLMAFVTSALTCGSLLLGYPLWLILKGRVKEAVLVVAWSVVWLITILFVCLLIGLALR